MPTASHRTEGGIAARHPREALGLRLALAVAAALLAVGLVAPVITLERFVVVRSEFSVVSGAWGLLREGQPLLFVLVAGFSVVLPVLKLIVLYRALGGSGPALRRALALIHRFGRWSMLDVFVVAVLVVSVKLGAIASVEVRYGLYAFAGAVLLTMGVTARVVWLTDSLYEGAGDVDGLGDEAGDMDAGGAPGTSRGRRGR